MFNYPDVLGYITGGQHVNINGVQVALAVAPDPVRAGRPFQVLLLAQNTTDVNIELAATLNLPGRDAGKQKDRFRAYNGEINVELGPVEAGYVLLPAVCHPATAPAKGYKLGVAVSVRPKAKATVIRTDNPAPIQHQAAVGKLKTLAYSTSKRFGLRDELEAPFAVVPGEQVKAKPPTAGWNSLWNLAENGTNAMLLAHYKPLIKERIVPALKSDHVFKVLCQATEARYAAAGYRLEPLEAVYIAKLLTLVMRMANPGDDQHDYLGSQHFNVAVRLKHGEDKEVELPRWFEALLRVAASDLRVAAKPIEYTSAKLYDALIRDTLPFAFAMIHKVTGEDMGTPDEISDYTHNYIRLLHDGGMDFAHAYLPLIMGGVIVYDRVILPEETLEDTLRDMGDVLDKRDAEWDEANDLVFLLTRELVNRSLRLFGFEL